MEVLGSHCPTTLNIECRERAYDLLKKSYYALETLKEVAVECGAPAMGKAFAYFSLCLVVEEENPFLSNQLGRFNLTLSLLRPPPVRLIPSNSSYNSFLCPKRAVTNLLLTDLQDKTSAKF